MPIMPLERAAFAKAAKRSFKLRETTRRELSGCLCEIELKPERVARG